MAGIINRPNNIIAKQIKYQSSELPIYLRQPRSKLYMGLYLGAFTVGVVGTFTGLFKMIMGSKPEA